MVNGNQVSYNRTDDDVETGFEIPLTPAASKVQILAMPNGINQSSKTKEEITQNETTINVSNQSVISTNGSSKTVNIEIPQETTR